MNWLRYLGYISIIPALIALIQQAQAAFNASEGTEKYKSVQQSFSALVSLLMTTGLLSARLGTRLIAVSGALIELVLDVLKDENGGVVPLPPVPIVPGADGIYGAIHPIGTLPNDDGFKALGFKAGDLKRKVDQFGRTYWFVSHPDGTPDHGGSEEIGTIA